MHVRIMHFVQEWVGGIFSTQFGGKLYPWLFALALFCCVTASLVQFTATFSKLIASFPFNAGLFSLSDIYMSDIYFSNLSILSLHFLPNLCPLLLIRTKSFCRYAFSINTSLQPQSMLKSLFFFFVKMKLCIFILGLISTNIILCFLHISGNF